MSDIQKTIQTLRDFNLWRKGDDAMEQPDPWGIGEAIDEAIEAMEKLGRLTDAALAVVDRWETPFWKQVEHTGVYIAALRKAVEEVKGGAVSAGKGDSPRPVNGDAYRDNYEAAFRKAKWPHDDNPFMSADHDNDSSVYDEAVASVYEERNNCITYACRVSSVCRQLKDKLEAYRRHTDTIITLLEIVEETDEGRQFSPNTIQSCRSFDLHKIGEAITHIKLLNDET